MYLTENVLLVLLLLVAGVLSIHVTFITLGMEEETGQKLPSSQYIRESVFDVAFRTLQENYENVLNNMTVIPLLSNETLPDYTKICENVQLSFNLLTHLYGIHPDLFESSFSNHSMTVIASGEFCDALSSEVANFATSTNVIFLSSSTENKLSNVTAYPTTLNIVPTSTATLFAALRVLLRQQHWMSTAFFCIRDDFVFGDECDTAVKDFFYDNNFVPNNTVRVRHTVDEFDRKVRDILQDLMKRARIIWMLISPDRLRKFMIAAYEVGMTDGTYVFIAPYRQPVYGAPQILHWQASEDNPDEHSSDDYKAFAGFLRTIIISDINIDWKHLENFTNEVAEHSQEHHNRTIPPHQRRDIVSVLFMDVLSIFAAGLQTMLPNITYLNPATFVKGLLDHTYHLKSRQVHLKADGREERATPYLRLNPGNKEFEAAAEINLDSLKFYLIRKDLWNWTDGMPFPPDMPPCGFNEEHCRGVQLEILIPCLLIAVLLATTAAVYRYLKQRADKRTFSAVFIPETQMSLYSINKAGTTTLTSKKSAKPHGVVLVEVLEHALTKRQLGSITQFRTTVLKILKLSHSNIAMFHGIGKFEKLYGLIWEFSERGNIETVLLTKHVLSDVTIRLSLLGDLLQGLSYIHKSSLEFHGDLSMAVCFVDNRYTLKVAKVGCFQLLESVQARRGSIEDKKSVAQLRVQDVRNFGKISAFMSLDFENGTTETVHKRSSNQLIQWKQLTEFCITATEWQRPSLTEIKNRFNKIKPSKNIVQYVVQAMDNQMQELETKVQDKTKDLMHEKVKVEQLLLEMLPQLVVNQLRDKKPINPETFDSVSVLFSDIPIFSKLAVQCTPWQLVTVLNTVYSAYDNAFELYDAYKVETISDSYMVSSGVPVRNGADHAVQICLLALHLLKISRGLEIPVSADSHLVVQNRVGIHSGPVVAGVIGSRMPRYCLFGDTVNTASRMETNGEAGRIHVGRSTESLASRDSRLLFDSRGQVTLKGKGTMETFWLHPSKLTDG